MTAVSAVFTFLFLWFVQHFRHRCHHRFLTLIIHLKEIAVTAALDTYKYSLTNEVSQLIYSLCFFLINWLHYKYCLSICPCICLFFCFSQAAKSKIERHINWCEFSLVYSDVLYKYDYHSISIKLKISDTVLHSFWWTTYHIIY